MNLEVSPAELAADVKRRAAQRRQRSLSILWVGVPTSRTEFADELNEYLDDVPAAAVVVRGARFENPNAVFDDLVTLLDEERPCLEERLARGGPRGSCTIVLIARGQLRISQASSPVALPDWFPVCGGTTVTSRIEDLTWTAQVSLRELPVDDLSRLLFDLDAALLDRLFALRNNRRALQSFVDRVRGKRSTDEFLGQARTAHEAVQNASGFRPSLRERDNIVSCLWYLVQSEKPDGLSSSVNALRQAIGIPPDFSREWHETFMTVLSRPTSLPSDEGARFVRNMLLTVRASAQLTTAVAHAGDYAVYPASLMRATSLDLRRGLSDAISVVRTL